MHPIHVLCDPRGRNFLSQPCVAVLHMRKFVGTGRFATSHVVSSDPGTHISRAPRPATPRTHPSVPLVMACRVPAVRIEPNMLPALPELVICVGGRHRLPILGVGGQKVLASVGAQEGGLRAAGVQWLPSQAGEVCCCGHAWTCPAVGGVVSFISSQPQTQIKAPVLTLPPGSLAALPGNSRRGSGVHTRAPEGCWGASQLLVEFLPEAKP